MSPRGQRGGGGTGAKERVERKEREGTEGEGENKDGMAVVRKGSSRLGSVAEARREPRREWTQFSRLARQTQVNSATRFLAHSPEQNQPCHQTNPSAPQTRLDALPLSEGPRLPPQPTVSHTGARFARNAPKNASEGRRITRSLQAAHWLLGRMGFIPRHDASDRTGHGRSDHARTLQHRAHRERGPGLSFAADSNCPRPVPGQS